MKSADVYPSKWLAAADIEGHEPTVTIDHVILEEISQNDKKPVIYFKGKTKGMICNKTNWKRIEYITGCDDSDDWAGRQVTLYVELVDMQGQMKPALRVKPPVKRTQPTNGKVEFVTQERDGYTMMTSRRPEPVERDDDLPEGFR